MIRLCARCETPFDVPEKHPKQRLCSRQCNGRVRPGETYGQTPTYQCEHCGKTAERRRFRFADGRVSGHDYGQRFCSKACGYAGRKWRPINPNGYVHSSGYIRVDLRGGKKAFQHRVVMEEMIGRPLRPGENVHHVNGQRTDNRPENLELWSEKQPPGQRVVDKVQFGIDMLLTYPEFIAGLGYEVTIKRIAAEPETHPTDASPEYRPTPR